MSLDGGAEHSQRIAIIGAGISGMAAAYLLAPHHKVTLIEAEPRLGGHARTVLAGRRGDQPVDTGFIVFNYVNYPHLTRLFQDLNVPVEKSDMSFGATINGGEIEYGLATISALFGQRRNLLRPGFTRMVRDILRFNAQAEAHAKDETTTIGELVDQLGLGRWFQEYYLMPICGAIWSTPAKDIRDFPAKSLVQFFRNHALLSATGQHQWWTVSGGSIEYVKRLEAHLRAAGVEIRTGYPVERVTRGGFDVTIHQNGQQEVFDQVVFACHSDTALALLADPSDPEHAALSDLRYQDNEMVLHADAGQMPRRRACWSSWVYQAHTDHKAKGVGVTYWMNRLQNIPENDPLFVTLNPVTAIDPSKIYDRKLFRHPIFDGPALEAQKRISALQGTQNTWYAGAYLRHGFHEDGFASAVRVARALCPASV